MLLGFETLLVLDTLEVPFLPLWKPCRLSVVCHAGSQLCAMPFVNGAFSQQHFTASQESRNAQKYVKYLGKEAKFAEIWEYHSEAEEFGVLWLSSTSKKPSCEMQSSRYISEMLQ